MGQMGDQRPNARTQMAGGARHHTNDHPWVQNPGALGVSRQTVKL